MIGAFIFLGIGFILFIIGIVIYFKGIRTGNWKLIVGRIKEVKLGGHYSSGSGGVDGGGGSMSYQCLVNYEYDSPKENGILKGDKIAIGYNSSSNKQAHLKIKEKLESSDKVQLWMNPNDETQTVICKGPTRIVYFLWTFGLMLILFSLGMMMLHEPEERPTTTEFFDEYKVEVIEYKTDK